MAYDTELDRAVPAQAPAAATLREGFHYPERLLYVSGLEEVVVGTVHHRGHADTNGPIARALMAAVHGREAAAPSRILIRWLLTGIAGVTQPRPAAFWPGALHSAEHSLDPGRTA